LGIEARQVAQAMVASAQGGNVKGLMELGTPALEELGVLVQAALVCDQRGVGVFRGFGLGHRGSPPQDDTQHLLDLWEDRRES
jgi:hypothetical protein